MRPRKKVLLWGERDEIATLAFVLNCQPDFAATRAAKDDIFARLLAQGAWRLVILGHSVSPRRTANKAALAAQVAGCPVLILTLEKGYPAPEFSEASAVLPYGLSNAEVIQHVRVLTARKHGRPKGSGSKPVAAVAGTQEAAHAG